MNRRISLLGVIPAVAVRSSHSSSHTMSDRGATVRIVSYNVLSDSLCSPSYYHKCPPVCCDPEFRLELVRRKLETEMKKGSVICLQEVRPLRA